MFEIAAEIRVNCLNVMYGSKLIAEVHYQFKDKLGDDILFFEKVLKPWPEIKYQVNYHRDKKAAKEGHKSLIIYKHSIISKILDELDKLDSNSLLYHFVNGKLFGYNDFEVIKFLSVYGDGKTKIQH
jgi:gamma-glutamyl-gamma-aminobutyrate hydrolase PuuD